MNIKIGSYSEWVEFEDSNGKKSDININFEYFLTPDMVYLWADYSDDKPLQTWQLDNKDLPITKFYDPEKIITNLIDNLYKKANRNKEVINKLQILKNILELSDLTK